MKWFLYAFGLVWITCGSCMILYTVATRNVFRNMLGMMKPVPTSIVAAILGILFIASASASHYPWFIRVIGILSILEGVLYFFNPGDALQKMYDYFIETISDQTYRLLGIVIIILGTAILSWIV